MNVEPTYQVVEQRGQGRVSVTRWTAATLAATRKARGKAGTTTASFNPIDATTTLGQVKGEVMESNAPDPSMPSPLPKCNA